MEQLSLLYTIRYWSKSSGLGKTICAQRSARTIVSKCW
jgi:hypothetical protein